MGNLFRHVAAICREIVINVQSPLSVIPNGNRQANGARTAPFALRPSPCHRSMGAVPTRNSQPRLPGYHPPGVGWCHWKQVTFFSREVLFLKTTNLSMDSGGVSVLRDKQAFS